MGPFFEEFAMEGVTVIDHPLVQHKLTLLRDKSSSTKSFRELLKEIGMLLCYEVTRDLPLTEVEVETPLARMQSAKIAGKKLVFVHGLARRRDFRRRHDGPGADRTRCAYRPLPRATHLRGS
jgi:hypothetical protein